MKPLSGLCEKYKQELLFSMGATFFWGLAAHAYCFLNTNLSHDVLVEFHGAIFGNHHKLGSGRFFVPLYRDLFRGDITLPWQIGLLSLVWLGFAVFLVVRIFEIKSNALVFLTAGILVTNISVSALAATFLHDMDGDMVSVLCAVAAAFLWQGQKKYMFAGGEHCSFCRWDFTRVLFL